MEHQKDIMLPVQTSHSRIRWFAILGAILLVALGISSAFGIAQSTMAALATSRTNIVEVQNTIYIQGFEVGGEQPRTRIVALDSATTAVRAEYETQYEPAARLTKDGRTLYVFDTMFSQPSPLNTLRAIDTSSGAVTWQVQLLGLRGPWITNVNTGVWLSTDEHRVYALMLSEPEWLATQTYVPRIVVVDAMNHTAVKEFTFQLPYDLRMAHVFFWKLPWAEELLIAFGDKLLSVNLDSGQVAETITLSGLDDRSRIPQNLNQWGRIWGGVIAPQAHRLYLATYTQDILAVDFNGHPTAQKVFSLPSGWQFGISAPVISNDERSIYLGVRPTALPLTSGRVVTEVWDYDLASWQRKGTLKPTGVVLTMALSRDGQRLFTINHEDQSMSIHDVQSMRELKIVRNFRPQSVKDSGPRWIISP